MRLSEKQENSHKSINDHYRPFRIIFCPEADKKQPQSLFQRGNHLWKKGQQHPNGSGESKVPRATINMTIFAAINTS